MSRQVASFRRRKNNLAMSIPLALRQYGVHTQIISNGDSPAGDPMTASQLIARSISHSEIVLSGHSAQLASELYSVCDDCVIRVNGTDEYWGTDEDGDEWRVHLAK